MMDDELLTDKKYPLSQKMWNLNFPGFNPGKKDSRISARQDETYKIRSIEPARSFRPPSGQLMQTA